MRKYKLSKEFRSKWLKALESGKYKQGTGELYNNSTKRFCCLGVAGVCLGIDKSILNGKGMPHILSTESTIKYPKCLLGGISENRSFASKLARMNDNGESFKYIAKYIRKQTVGV